MGFLGRKLRRAGEALHLLHSHAADWRARATLLACYASILRSTTDPTEVDLRLRIRGSTFPLRMRKSDLFTLAEILHDRLYQLRSRLKDRPTIVDAGANIGISALWFLAHYPGAQLHAFEPEPQNFRLLEHNLGSIPGVVLNRAALWQENGRLPLRLADHGAIHSVVDQSVGPRSIEVECTTLADYLERRGISTVDLLKLDVEGSEAQVLQGLGARIADVKVIAGELHERLVDEEAFYAHLGRHGLHRISKTYLVGGLEAGVHCFEVA